MKREPGFMGLAKRNAKKKPISPEQQQFRQQLGQEMQADQAQEQGMVDKMSAYNRMQQDKQRMMEIPFTRRVKGICLFWILREHFCNQWI